MNYLFFRWLLEKKVPAAELDSMLEEKDADGQVYDIIQVLPHHDQETWLMHCDRHHAEDLLKDARDGTFLIRPKVEEGDVFVLSIS